MLFQLVALVFALLPIIVIYFTGGFNNSATSNANRKKKRNKKKRNEQQELATKDVLEKKPQQEMKKNEKNKKKSSLTEETKGPVKQDNKKEKDSVKQDNKKKDSVKQDNKKKESDKQDKNEAEVKKEEAETKLEESTKVNKTREIDEHMDPTAHYSRVMRIKPEEEEDEWEAVPYEDGWNQVNGRRPPTTAINTGSSSASMMNTRLDKKQRENAAKRAKEKAAKAEAEELRLKRLRAHQKQLEKLKIDEFYSTGKGKNSPWSKKKTSSKVPNSTASINEYGQLIWE